MNFVKAYKEAQKIGLTMDTFKSIWDKETELALLEIQRESSRTSASPDVNITSSSCQFHEELGEIKNICQTIKHHITNVDNVLAELSNSHRNGQMTLQKIVEDQQAISELCNQNLELHKTGNDKLMTELCHVVRYIGEQSRHDTDLIRTYIQQECQFLYHDQARSTAQKNPQLEDLRLRQTDGSDCKQQKDIDTDVHNRSGHKDIDTDVRGRSGRCDPVLHDASSVPSHNVLDIVSVLTKSYSLTPNNTEYLSSPEFVADGTSPQVAATIRHPYLSEVEGQDVASAYIPTTDSVATHKLPSEIKNGVEPHSNNQRTSDSNSKKFRDKVIEQVKENVQGGEKFQDNQIEQAKENVQGGEKSQDNQIEQVKENVQGGEKSQDKDPSKGAEKNDTKYQPQVKDEEEVEESDASDNELYHFGKKENILNERRKIQPLRYSASFNHPNSKRPAYTERPTRARSTSDSESLVKGSDDFSRRSFRVVDSLAKFIPDTGLTFELLTSYLNMPSFYETDYFYTQPKKCRMKLRLVLNKRNALCVHLCVSRGATVGELTWPIYFDGIGKVYNAETNKPSLLWKFNNWCQKPNQDEEIKLDAAVCLITKDGNYENVTLELLKSQKFATDNILRFFWKLTAD